MIIANEKPIQIIGYTESTMTAEFVNAISLTHPVEVVRPVDFLSLENKDSYQYIISVSVDLNERRQLIDIVDQLDLDLITVIHDSVLLNPDPSTIINPGTFIFPFCNIVHGAQIGRHCIVSSYSLIGHYTVVGDNCIIRPGVMITDRSVIGKNCMINIRSTVTNKVNIADNVKISGCSSVTKDITQPGRYAGTPARRVGDF
jgi:carbonic anhydrase/acetyltransferase-like protein (isoleucine patch superfamily)